KIHSSHFENLQKIEIEELAQVLRIVLLKLEASLEFPPYNYIIHTTPFVFGEIEHYHWHIEIIPRLTRVAGFEWGTGFYINTVTPESAAEFLRNASIERKVEVVRQ
ncbi:MAG: galactose-1-phosphate uridylyltransferase, partial [Planctomycetota bacterium]